MTPKEHPPLPQTIKENSYIDKIALYYYNDAIQ